MFPLYTYVKNVFPATCQTVQPWKQKVDITCGLLLVVPFDKVSSHTLKPTRTLVWPVISSLFLMSDMMTHEGNTWNLITRAKWYSRSVMFWPRGVSSKMGLDGGFKAFFFYRSLGFSRAVCSLSSLTPKAEIQVTNMWMTPLIQTMPDDYSYFCIPITASLQAHLHAWNAHTKHAHTSHLKYL